MIGQVFCTLEMVCGLGPIALFKVKLTQAHMQARLGRVSVRALRRGKVQGACVGSNRLVETALGHQNVGQCNGAHKLKMHVAGPVQTGDAAGEILVGGVKLAAGLVCQSQKHGGDATPVVFLLRE